MVFSSTAMVQEEMGGCVRVDGAYTTIFFPVGLASCRLSTFQPSSASAPCAPAPLTLPFRGHIILEHRRWVCANMVRPLVLIGEAALRTEEV